MQRLEKQLEKLETEKSALEEKLKDASDLDREELELLTSSLGKLTNEVSQKEERWLKLSELDD
jgi:hypothetical protein